MRTKQKSSRAGTSLMEVIAGMTLMAMLMVPTVGLLTASGRIWRQFESGHGSIAARQATIQDINNRIEGAVRVISVSGAQLRFQAKAGDTQRVYQTGNRIFWEHAGRADLIGEAVGTLFFRQLQSGANPAQGVLVEIRLQNANGSNVANVVSTNVVWIKPII